MTRRTWSVTAAVMLVAVMVLTTSSVARASYAFYVGKSLTADGSVLIGGTGEEVSGHWLEIVPRRRHPEGATVRVGVTAEANLPGELIEIPQVPETYRYISMSYSDFEGFPPPLTNGGLNEHGLAVRDVWTEVRKELVEMTPTPQRGLNYSDIARIVLERARSAREAVATAGALIDRFGYATYGGNSHMFADAEEGWVMIQLPGGQGLWVAERLGPDEVRVSYPGYIGEVPADYLDHPDFMGSSNLISFAVKHGWYDPAAGEPFDVHEVYLAQGRQMRSPGLKYVDQATLETELMAMAPQVTVRDMMMSVRDYRIADDEAGYGQVAHLRKDVHPELRTLWVAPTGSITAPFIPYRIGVQQVPPEYGKHRYLARESGSTFLHPDYSSQEATRFAGRLFKRLMYHTCEHPELFLPEVTAALTAFEARMLDEQDRVEQTALVLYQDERVDLAREYLTTYSTSRAEDALSLGEALLGSIEARTKVLFGIRESVGDDINAAGHDTVNCRRTGATPGMQRPASPAAPPPYPPDQVYRSDGNRRERIEQAPRRPAEARGPTTPPIVTPADPAARPPEAEAPTVARGALRPDAAATRRPRLLTTPRIAGIAVAGLLALVLVVLAGRGRSASR